MDKKYRKPINPHKLDDLLRQQEHSQKEKPYSPGKVNIVNSDKCKCRVVNFFGDVHTETFSVQVSLDDKIAAVACSNGDLKLYDIYEGKVLNIGNTSRKSNFPCTGVRWNPMHPTTYVSSNCDGTIKWFKIDNQIAYGHYESEESYLSLDTQIKGEWTVLGTDTANLRLFDNETFKLIQDYPAGGAQELQQELHTNRIFSIKCLPKDPFVFFSGGWDSTVQVWDVRVKGKSVRKISGPTISGDSLDLLNDTLLVGNYRNNEILQTYDFKSGKLIRNIDIQQPANSASYCFTTAYAHRSEHNLIAVGLTGSNKVKILRDEKVVAQIMLQDAPLSLGFYRFNKKDFLLTGGMQGTVYAVKVKSL